MEDTPTRKWVSKSEAHRERFKQMMGFADARDLRLDARFSVDDPLPAHPAAVPGAKSEPRKTARAVAERH